MNEEIGTSLAGKEYEPLVLRRYSTPILHWVCLISGDNLDRLDQIVSEFWEKTPISQNMSIQDWRNLAGKLQEVVIRSFKKVESGAVVMACDKMMVSSLYGDAMNHLGCRMELYMLMNTSNLL
jgi:hypothetical protein